MTREAAGVVERWMGSLAQGELGLDLCHSEIEIANWENMPNAGPYRGLDGVRRWWTDSLDTFEELSWVPLELIDLGDERFLTTQRLAGRFRHTGLEVDVEWGAIVTVRDGLIAAAHGYPSVARARRAAGLGRSSDRG